MPTPPQPQPPPAAKPWSGAPPPPSTPAVPRAAGEPPKLKPAAELDRRTLQAAGTFDVVLRGGQTWRRVRLLEMDSWNLLLETEQGRVLLPKHSVDWYGLP